MMPTPLLTNNDLRALTGYVRPSSQIAWLRANGFVFRVAADGHPRVDRAHYERVMGASSGEARTRTAPNLTPLLTTRKAA